MVLNIDVYVLTMPNSLTLLRSRGLRQFKCSFLFPPSKTPFKDKIVTDRLQSGQYLRCMVIDPNDVTWWTWDWNIDALHVNDNEVLKMNHQSLKPYIGDDLSFPLDLNWGAYVSTIANNPTSLRSWGLRRFKYHFLLSPSKASFKDKIGMNWAEVDNTSDAWWLALTMSFDKQGTKTLASIVGPITRF